MRIKFVATKDDFGCAIACLAMVTGRTYDDVSADFMRDFNKEGMPWMETVQYAGDAGFAIIEKHYSFWNSKDACMKEMYKPFADVHIMSVRPYADSKESHAVVMTSTGRIICPSKTSSERIKLSYAVNAVAGLYL